MNANAEIGATLKMDTKGHESKSGWEGKQVTSEGNVDWPGSRRALRKGVGGLDRWAEANAMNYNETECRFPHVACDDLGRWRGWCQSERKTMERERTGGYGKRLN